MRYAIYFVPDADSDLYRFGSAVLGYDCYSGRDVPLLPRAIPDWRCKTRGPHAYGFHATLMAPFRLAAWAKLSDLQSEVNMLVASRPSIDAGRLETQEISSFVALALANRCQALEGLAADCVRKLDHFRAPPDEREQTRRRAVPLTERQKLYLDRWGYPYIFEDFRFHMTLSGPLPMDERRAALRWLRDELAARPAARWLTVDRLTIVTQDNGPFRVVQPQFTRRESTR